MSTQDEYVRMTFRLPPEMHEALNMLAQRHARSQNGELIALLMENLKREGVIFDPAMGSGEMLKLAAECTEATYRKYAHASIKDIEMALAKKFKALGRQDQILVMELIDRLAA